MKVRNFMYCTISTAKFKYLIKKLKKQVKLISIFKRLWFDKNSNSSFSDGNLINQVLTRLKLFCLLWVICIWRHHYLEELFLLFFNGWRKFPKMLTKRFCWERNFKVLLRFRIKQVISYSYLITLKLNLNINLYKVVV